MDIKNSNGLVGKYNSRDVYVTTREEYDGATHHQDFYYILKDYSTVEGYPMLLFRDRIKGYCKNDGGIKIYDRDVYYVREDRREYKYTMKEDDYDDAKHHQSLDLNKMCASASEYIKDGLLHSGRLLEQEQERAQELCR